MIFQPTFRPLSRCSCKLVCLCVQEFLCGFVCVCVSVCVPVCVCVCLRMCLCLNPLWFMPTHAVVNNLNIGPRPFATQIVGTVAFAKSCPYGTSICVFGTGVTGEQLGTLDSSQAYCKAGHGDRFRRS